MCVAIFVSAMVSDAVSRCSWPTSDVDVILLRRAAFSIRTCASLVMGCIPDVFADGDARCSARVSGFELVFS